MILIGLLYFFLGVVQLLLALIFTIRRSSKGTGWRGWLYYWMMVGIYFVVLIGIVVVYDRAQSHESDVYFDQIRAHDTNTDIPYPEPDHQLSHLLKQIGFAWFGSAILIAVYFFFANSISDRIAAKKRMHQQFHN